MSNHPLVYAMVPVYHHPYISNKAQTSVDLLNIAVTHAQPRQTSRDMLNRVAKAQQVTRMLYSLYSDIARDTLNESNIDTYERKLFHIRDSLVAALEPGAGVY